MLGIAPWVTKLANVEPNRSIPRLVAFRPLDLLDTTAPGKEETKFRTHVVFTPIMFIV